MSLEIIAFAISLVLSTPGALIVYYAMKGDPIFKMSYEEYEEWRAGKKSVKIV